MLAAVTFIARHTRFAVALSMFITLYTGGAYEEVEKAVESIWIAAEASVRISSRFSMNQENSRKCFYKVSKGPQNMIA